jgi:histidine triad (HIT) family protein
MKCDYCEIIDGKEPVEIIFRDKDVLAFVDYKALAPGQITVVPTEHYTILEMVPNKILEKLFNVANKLSIVAFEVLGVQGTNIFIKNGLGANQTVPHFAVHIIPRKENDGLNLMWNPQELSEFDLEDAMVQITSNTEGLDISKEDTIEDSGVEETTGEDAGDGEEGNAKKPKKEKQNYLLKSIKRRP